MSASIRFKNADGEPELADGTIHARGLSSAATVAATSPSPVAPWWQTPTRMLDASYSENSLFESVFIRLETLT